MIRELLYKLSGELPCRLIKIDDRDYLERYYIGKLFGFTFYLHRFVAPDGERKVHDHPWRTAFSVVLAGSYVEEWVQWMDLTAEGGWSAKMRRIRWFNWIPGHRFHRVANAEPETWTLFVHGGRVKGWGFLNHEPYAGNPKPEKIVLYHQPFDIHATDGWYKTAPKGDRCARAGLK